MGVREKERKKKKKESGERRRESLAVTQVACVGGNSSPWMTPRRHAASSSTWTTSPSTLVSLFFFTCFKSFPFSTFAQVNGGGNWLLPLRNRFKRETIASEKPRPGALRYSSRKVLWFLRFHGFRGERERKRRQDRVLAYTDSTGEKRKAKETPLLVFWSKHFSSALVFLIATSSRTTTPPPSNSGPTSFRRLSQFPKPIS